MLDRYNRARLKRRAGERRSKLEDQVAENLETHGYSATYEQDKFKYVISRTYRPDFKVGDFYIEVKGWWQQADRSKFLAVVLSNPDLPIFVALQRPLQRISKTSRTTYAEWCTRWGICWCPIPIPPDFLHSWATGQRTTFHVPTKKAAAQQTQLQFVRTVPFTASPADDGSTHPPQ